MALIADFITEQWKSGLSYSTINGYRSAISAFHEQIEGMPVGQHPLVKRALAGVFNENPPQPKYTDMWDVGVVLKYIDSLGPNGDLDDGQMTRKLTMLLALSNASRASELQALNVGMGCMEDRDDHMVFILPKLTKTRRPGEKPGRLVLHQYQENPRLDVVRCVRSYIVRSKDWRTTEAHHQLLLGTVEPHKPVVTSTISNWLKKLMSEAGIDTSTYTGHSVRSASVSKAKAGGVSVADIVRKANWKNASTFHKFYDRTVTWDSDTFAQAVWKQ